MDENKRNLHYFEAESVRELFDIMDGWQKAHEQRLLSTSIHKDQGRFCCIALTNPTEVIIVDGSSTLGGVKVSLGQGLRVYIPSGPAQTP